MKTLSKSAKICITVCSVLVLTACSQGKTASTLQNDFDSYKYSDFVRANLKIKTPVSNNGNLNNVQKQAALSLSKGQNRASANLNSVITNNGLFKPSRVVASVDQLSRKAPIGSVLTVALNRNLDIKSTRQQAQASLAKYNQVEFLSDTLKQYASFTKDLKLTGSAKRNKAVSYPSPGLNSIKSSIIDESVKYSRLKLKQTSQNVITNARIAYVEMQSTRREVQLLGGLISQFKSLKQELQNNYETNTGELDLILQADIDIAASQNKRRLARDKLNANQARLNALLNIPVTIRFTRVDKLKLVSMSSNISEASKVAHKQRVEIALLQTELIKMQRVIQLSEKRLYPDLDAGFSRTQKGKFNTKPKVRQNNYFAKNDAYLEETRQKAQALSLKIEALKNTTSDELQQNFSNQKSQLSTYKLYRNKIIPKAKSSLDIAKNAFEIGSSDKVKVIKAEIAIQRYRLLLLDTLRGLNISHIKALRIIGSELQ